MADPAERVRTVLRAPRVEFDLSALALGAGGWLAYQLSWPALASLLAVPTTMISAGGGPEAPVAGWHALRWTFFHRVVGFVGLQHARFIEEIAGVPGVVGAQSVKEGKPALWQYSFADQAALAQPWWKLAVVGVWLLVLWSIVAGAISRVYAVRIARDESIRTGDALAFSMSNLLAFLKAPLFVAGAAAVFLGLCALAGVVSAVPTAGPFLQVIFHPLALIAGLLVTVIAVGGIFGLPVMQAAVATERNGALDAISRTFSYVFTRPVAYIVSLVVITIVAGLILQFGMEFIALTTRAMAFGASWNEPGDAKDALAAGWRFAVDQGGVLGWPQAKDPSKVSTLSMFAVYVAWFFTALARTVVSGFVLSYFVGGLTDTYFMLRRDVDGIDDSEVYVEGETATLGEPVVGEPTAPGAKP